MCVRDDEHNYRSTPQIIAAANSLISANLGRVRKDLIPALPDGPPVVYHHAKTAEAEARWIASRIRELTDKGASLGDITILYRAHYVSRSLEEVFMKEELPYTIYSGVQFFARAEVKDALSYLRLIAYRDDLSFMRVANTPKRNLGERACVFCRITPRATVSRFRGWRRSVDDELFSGRARKSCSRRGALRGRHAEMPVSECSRRLWTQRLEEMLRTREGTVDNLAELKQLHEYEVSCGEESTLESYFRMLRDDQHGRGLRQKLRENDDGARGQGLEFRTYSWACRRAYFVQKDRHTGGMEEERRARSSR
jgi:DNA helicase-2/ATP-dependent DNA helicase PcrA